MKSKTFFVLKSVFAFLLVLASVIVLAATRAAVAPSGNSVVNPSEEHLITPITTDSAASNLAEPSSTTTTQIPFFQKEHAIMIAKTIYGEARGIWSQTEQACIVWTILNRVDAGYGSIDEVITASHQFYYRAHFPVIDDFGRDLVALAEDVLWRWSREKCGEKDVGRVLPSNYLWYYGDGEHNWFRDKFKGRYNIWHYTLESPYENLKQL